MAVSAVCLRVCLLSIIADCGTGLVHPNCGLVRFCVFFYFANISNFFVNQLYPDKKLCKKSSPGIYAKFFAKFYVMFRACGLTARGCRGRAWGWWGASSPMAMVGRKGLIMNRLLTENIAAGRDVPCRRRHRRSTAGEADGVRVAVRISSRLCRAAVCLLLCFP